MKKISLAIAGLALVSGCTMKQKIMDVAVVSMTRSSLPAGATLKETGDVSGKFCSDQFNDKGQIGLFDEAIKQAQKQSGTDFITNASFFSEGSCVTVEGTGQKIAEEKEAVKPSKQIIKK